jgi:hypothetical protein
MAENHAELTSTISNRWIGQSTIDETSTDIVHSSVGCLGGSVLLTVTSDLMI